MRIRSYACVESLQYGCVYYIGIKTTQEESRQGIEHCPDPRHQQSLVGVNPSYLQVDRLCASQCNDIKKIGNASMTSAQVSLEPCTDFVSLSK